MLDRKDIYYNGDKARSYNALFTFVLSMRGGGKTFDFKKYALNRWIKRREKFIYIRRYKEEMKGKVEGFFTDVQKEVEKFAELELSGKGKRFYCGKDVIGYAVTLSQYITEKSDSKYSDVTTIIFDEFIIPRKSHTRYLNDEVYALMDLYETIVRMRDEKIFLLANNISIVNPYFTFFNIRPNPKKEYNYYHEKGVLVQYYHNDQFVETKKATRFGKMLEGTRYGKYAIENESLYDDDKNIEKKSKKAKYQFSIKYDNKTLGVWIDYDASRIYCSSKHDPTGTTYVVRSSDIDVNMYLVKTYKKVYWVNMFMESFFNSYLYFENQNVKQLALDIITTLAPNI